MVKVKNVRLTKPYNNSFINFFKILPPGRIKHQKPVKIPQFWVKSQISLVKCTFLAFGGVFSPKYLRDQKNLFYSLVLGSRDLEKSFSELFDWVKKVQKWFLGIYEWYLTSDIIFPG